LAASRPVYPPDPDFFRRPLKRALLSTGPWLRIHPSTKSAVYFSRRASGRFTPADPPFGVLYAAVDITTALFEVFGDEMFENDHRIRAYRWMHSSVSELETPRAKVCNVASRQVRSSIKVDLGTLMGQDFSATQAWALAIMRHPSEAEGIIYRSRFTNRNCLALFDRGKIPSLIKEELIGPLNGLAEANSFLDRNGCVIV
jgi:RES domain-containing protein